MAWAAVAANGHSAFDFTVATTGRSTHGDSTPAPRSTYACGVTFVTLPHSDLGRTIAGAESAKMSDPNLPRGKWEKVLGADFTKSLMPEESKKISAEPDFTKSFDLFLAEESKEVSAEQTVAEQPENPPQQILTEMGLTSTAVEPLQNAAIAVPGRNSSPALPCRPSDSRATDQTACGPTAQVTTPVGSGSCMVQPGNMAVPQPGNRYARQKQLQRPRHRFGVPQALIGAAIICLIIAVVWRAGRDRAAGPARLASTIVQAPGSNSDSTSESSSKTTLASNLAPAATSSSNRKIAAVILFAFDSSELGSESKKILRGIMEKILVAKNPAIEIHGYSDSVGDDAYNQFLSEERARAVRNYLVRIGTLKGVSIKIAGHGSDAAVADSNAHGSYNLEGREKNRRVEVILYDSSRNAEGN